MHRYLGYHTGPKLLPLRGKLSVVHVVFLWWCLCEAWIQMRSEACGVPFLSVHPQRSGSGWWPHLFAAASAADVSTGYCTPAATASALPPIPGIGWIYSPETVIDIPCLCLTSLACSLHVLRRPGCTRVDFVRAISLAGLVPRGNHASCGFVV